MADDASGMLAPPPLIYLGVLALALCLDWALAGPATGLPPLPRWTLSVFALAAGTALILSAVRGFAAAGTTPQPWLPATALVIAGVYRFTRNPMYVGMALVYAGLALAANSVIALAALPLALWLIWWGVIAREEAYMAAKFGEPYRLYCTQVRRWL